MSRLLLVASTTLMFFQSARAAALDDVSAVLDRSSHRSSSYDRTGGNEDNVAGFAPGATETLLDVDGPGRVTHIWMTVARFPGHEFLLRDLVVRMYWERSTVPSVEVPLGDFFGLGHGKLYAYQSLPMAVGANPAALNCYWPMPFYRHARIELFNSGSQAIRRLYYNVDYELGAIPAGQGLFHAMFNRDRALPGQSCAGNTTGESNYVIMETSGTGQYVGCTLSVDAQPGGWWGEGDEMIFIDGAKTPTIIGTGSEDYFCNAWGYKDAFSYLFYGAPLLQDNPNGSKLATVYRWHVPDPVRFRQDIKVTIEHCWDPGILNDFTSVAYWYQTEPIRQRRPLPPAAENQPGSLVHTVDATQLEPDCLARGIKARSITASPSQATGGGWLRIDTGNSPVELHIPTPRPGTYAVRVKVFNNAVESPLQIAVKDQKPVTIQKLPVKPEKPNMGEADVPYVDVGTAASQDGYVAVIVSGSAVVGLDGFQLLPPQAAAKLPSNQPEH